MIELRYVERNPDHVLDQPLRLQFRTDLNPLEQGMEDPLWSEWEDVPIVTWHELTEEE